MKVISTLIIFYSLSVTASSRKTICGKLDDRIISSDPKVGRLMNELKPTAAVCTVTMISRSCGITAGHCSKTFKYVQFNTPTSSKTGIIELSEDADTYEIDENQSTFVNRFLTDWGVVKVMQNLTTGAFAGDVQGHYAVSTETKPRVSDSVFITGYGSDGLKNERHFAQKEGSGEIEKITSRHIYHSVDTTGGNSGSAIIDQSSNEIVGIHTTGGCGERGGRNKGTLIYGNDALIDAVNKCLQSE